MSETPDDDDAAGFDRGAGLESAGLESAGFDSAVSGSG
jgi:hypothetical protein